MTQQYFSRMTALDHMPSFYLRKLGRLEAGLARVQAPGEHGPSLNTTMIDHVTFGGHVLT